MKKYFLLFILAFAASAMQAQNSEMYSLIYRETEEEDLIFDFMQQSDGDFVMNNFLEELEGDNYIPLGTMFYKISHASFSITDSLFVADTVPFILIARDPRGEGNITACLEYHEDCDSTFLRICHFTNDDLNINHDEDIISPICEGFACDAGGMVDCRGDLIFMYFKEKPGYIYDVYLARFDPDGTLKHQELLFENNTGVSPLRILKESPLQYYVWKRTNDFHPNIIIYTIDSLFHKNPVTLNSILSEEVFNPDYPYFTVNEYLSINGDTKVIPVGGDDILVAAQYVYDTTGHPTTKEYGVAVAKYDLRTMQLKDYVVFNDHPGYYKRAECLGIKMMTDGTVYLLYKEDGYPNESFMAVKMDANLNVDWKRFCKTGRINVWASLNSINPPILFENENGVEQGIAWTGYGKETGDDNEGFLCLFLNHDGPVNVANETVMEVRPYAFYPNPAKEQLCFEFSPDVQPIQVELYDLQGRLVRTQRSGLERIDMSRLPAGTYMMRVSMEDGKSYSDKVVKE